MRFGLTAFLPLLALVAAGCSSDPAPADPSPPSDAGADVHAITAEEQADFDAVVSYIESKLDPKNAPGAAVAVVLDGHLALARGIGTKTIAGDPVNAETLFRVGSMTKMVTAATVLSLVEEGKIDLAKPVTTYVPDLKLENGDPSTITVEELLTHTSGLSDSFQANCARGDDGIAQWLANEPIRLLVPPGTLWNYSNTGYVVAARVAEVAAGVPFRTLVEDRIFQRSGMGTSTVNIAATRGEDVASGHTGASGEPKEIALYSYDCAQTWGCGGVVASVVDYAHFIETLYAGGGTMIRPESVASMMSAHVPTGHGPRLDYGYGLMVERDYKGELLVHHNGLVDGFRAAMQMVPAKRFAVIAFVNGELVGPEAFVKKATDVFLGLTGPEPDDDTSPSTWGDYPGTYVDYTALGTMEVTLKPTELHLNAPSLDFDGRLVQVAGDTFVPEDPALSALTLTFFNGGAGPAKYLVSRLGVATRR